MNKYALLVSGGVNSGSNYGRYLNDLREIYRTLVVKCGYLKSNITVLYADGSSHDLDADGNNDISGTATKAGLQSALTTLQGQLTSNDLFFFYSTNHGGLSTGGKVKLWLWNNEYIEDSELATYINALTTKLTIVTMEQCYAGGFIDDLAGANRVIATACRGDQVSWACDSEGNYDEFVYHWTAAVRGETPAAVPVDATRGDGTVSLRDAFIYARDNDSRAEEPQFYENPPGISDAYTLCGLIPILPPCSSIARDLPCAFTRDICTGVRDIPCLVVRDTSCTTVRDLGCATVRDTPCAITRDVSCTVVRDTPCTVTRDLGCTTIRDLGCTTVRDTPCAITRDVGCATVRDVVCSTTRDLPCGARDVIATCGIRDAVLPCGRDVAVVTDPGDLVTRLVASYQEARGLYLEQLRALRESGVQSETIAQTLDALAQGWLADAGDALRAASELRSQNPPQQHVERLTRR